MSDRNGTAAGGPVVQGAPTRERRGTRPWRRLIGKEVWQPVLALVLLLVIWQLAVTWTNVSIFILPSPSDIWEAYWDNPSMLWSNLYVTAVESVLGLALALVVGIAIGTLIGYVSTARRIIFPYLVLLQVTPVVATAPLISIWFGYGLQSKVLITFLVAFFPITVGMATGLRSASLDSRMLMRSLASSRWNEFRRMRLPYATVYLVAGIRIAAPLTVIGAIIAEFVSSQRGLGYVIIRSQSSLDTPNLFVALVGAAMLGLTSYGIVSFVEHRSLRWHESVRGDR